MPPRTIRLPPPPTGPERPVVLARVYPGYHEQAIELFQIDAEDLALHGYVPVSQSYADGRYSPGFVTLSTLLVFVAIGIFLLLYMAAVRPPGSLAVTYMLRDVVR